MSRVKCLSSALMSVLCVGLVNMAIGADPCIKFGVLSDLHITNHESAETFRKALRYYREQDVDAVMVCGDLADYGLVSQLKEVADAWYDVFPDDKGRDGRHVEKIFIYGNHDVDYLGFYGNPGTAELLMFAPGRTPRELNAESIARYGLSQAWEECFHEKFAPVYAKNVKGYWFVGAHWDTQSGVRGLADFFKKNGDKLRGDRPFFYCQHPHPKGTVNRYGFYTHDDGCAARVLSGYPNAVAFSGHSHTTLTDERSLWRGSFTSIGCSTLAANGASTARIYEKLTPTENSLRPARQGLLVSVQDENIVIERRDFFFDETIDEPWVLETPMKVDWEFKTRAANDPKPEFGAGAFIEPFYPSLGQNGTLRFPQALANASARPFHYGITIEYRLEDEPISMHNFRIVSPTAHLPKSHDGDVPQVQCELPGKYLSGTDVGEYRITVEPCNSLGGAGKSLTTGWLSVPKQF